MLVRELIEELQKASPDARVATVLSAGRRSYAEDVDGVKILSRCKASKALDKEIQELSDGDLEEIVCIYV